MQSILDTSRLKGCYFVSVGLRMWGNTKTVKNPEALQEYYAMLKEEQAKASGDTSLRVTLTPNSNGDSIRLDKKRVKATKTLLVCKQLDDIVDGLLEAKGKVLCYCARSTIGPGIYICNKTYIQTIRDTVKAAQSQLQDIWLPALREAYEPAKENSRTGNVLAGGLGPLFDTADYPDIETVLGKYGIRQNVMLIDVPQGLDPEIYEEESKKLRERYDSAADKITDNLRLFFNDLIAKATERLSTTGAEKPKKFRDSLIDNMRDFFTTFKAQNVLNDASLAELVEKAEAALQGVEPERLRRDSQLRNRTAEALSEIDKAMTGMVKTANEREIDWDM